MTVDKKTLKAHNGPEEAFNCYARYLVKIGYTRLGSREFCLGDGPVVTLTKKSRFGALLRMGKNEKSVGSRYTFRGRTGGTVISK